MPRLAILLCCAGLAAALTTLLTLTHKPSTAPATSFRPAQDVGRPLRPAPDTAINVPQTHPPRLDYRTWQSDLRLPAGPVKQTLARLHAQGTPQAHYLTASLLHLCYLRQQNPVENSTQEGTPSGADCQALGKLAPHDWVVSMKEAADAGLASAQVAMALAEPPFRDDENGRRMQWLKMQHDYIDRAAAQCHPTAYIIRANYRFDTENPAAQDPVAYADFYTAELIYRNRFEHAPSLQELLKQEGQRLYPYQLREAQQQALINYHRACIDRTSDTNTRL